MLVKIHRTPSGVASAHWYSRLPEEETSEKFRINTMDVPFSEEQVMTMVRQTLDKNPTSVISAMLDLSSRPLFVEKVLEIGFQCYLHEIKVVTALERFECLSAEVVEQIASRAAEQAREGIAKDVSKGEFSMAAVFSYDEGLEIDTEPISVRWHVVRQE